MERQLTIFDLDRTLFDTASFFEDALIVWRAELGLNTTAFFETMDQYKGEAGHYDVEVHLRESGIDPEAAMRVLRDRLPPDGYLFSDAAALFERELEREVFILTTGPIAWQGLKLALTPRLESFKRKVIAGNKGIYLKDQAQNQSDGVVLPEIFPEQVWEGVQLVDDRFECLKPLADDERFRLYHIQRIPPVVCKENCHEVEHIDSLDALL